MGKNKSSGPGNITVVSYKSLSDMGQAIIQNQNDALAKITDAMAAQNGNKAGNTDLEQLEVLKKTLEIQKHLEKIAKSQQTALTKAFDEQTKGMKAFKTVGDRFNSIKQGIIDSLNPASMKKSILGSFNVFGLLNKQIAKVDFNERQKAYGVKGDFGGAVKASRDLQKANAEIDRLKKQGGLGEKATDKEIAALKGGKEALAARSASRNSYLQFDPAAMKAMQAQQSGFRGFSPPNDLTVPGSTLTHPKSTIDFVNPGQNGMGTPEENQLEAGRVQQTQLDLLQQIADNTAKMAGGGTGSSAGGPEDKGTAGGKGARALNGMSSAIQGIGDSIGALGQGVGRGIGGLIGGVFAGIMQGIADGISAFGTMKVVKGVAVIGLLTGVLYALTNVLDDFSQLDFGSIAKGALVVGGIALAIYGLGKGLTGIAQGVLALLGISAALWAFGKAMSAVADAFNSFIDGISRLNDIGFDNLLGTAGAITALAAAIGAFGAGTAAAGLGTLIGNLLTFGQDSPLEQLQKLADMGGSLMDAAQGVDAIGQAMKGFAGIDKDAMKAINDFPWTKATIFAAAGGAMSVKGASVYNASKANEEQKTANATPAPAAPSVNTNVQTNNSQTNVVKPNIRNQESSQAAYLAQRYRPTSY